MARRRSKRFPLLPSEEAELLADIEGWRDRCLALKARIPIQGSLYKALSGTTEAIDGIAEAVTGDRTTFWRKWHSAPGSQADG